MLVLLAWRHHLTPVFPVTRGMILQAALVQSIRCHVIALEMEQPGVSNPCSKCLFQTIADVHSIFLITFVQLKSRPI